MPYAKASLIKIRSEPQNKRKPEDVPMLTDELVANIVSNARMVPAGIVAVNRAQERGYTLVTA